MLEHRLVFKTMPVSTNLLYSRARRGVFVNKRARDCKEAIGFEARTQFHGKPLEGDLFVTIELYWGDARNHDIDNIKALLDALTGIIWVDDSQIQEMRLSKTIDRANPRCEMVVGVLK